MRVARILRDDRFDQRGKKLGIWNYFITTELQAGSQFINAQPGGQAYLIVGHSNEVIRIPNRGGAAWFAYLDAVYGLAEDDTYAKSLHAMTRAYTFRNGVKTELRRFSTYVHETRTAYISSYDGRMWKVDGARIERISNGEDGVFFADDDKGCSCPEPDIRPHGRVVDRLTSLNFAGGLSGITSDQQRKALTIWLFALAFQDLFPHKPILLVEGVMGSGKCLGRGTPVLMHDGSIKAVENIVDGDLVMGPDSTPRRVAGVTRGVGPLRKINPVKGDSWVCNDAHIMTVYLTGKRTKLGEIINRGVTDTPISTLKDGQWGMYLKGNYATLVRTGVDYPKREVAVDPYLLGAWLGDGTATKSEITCPDEEILSYCESMVGRYGLTSFRRIDPRNQLPTLVFTGGPRPKNTGPNPLLVRLRACVINGEKRIPESYLRNDRDTRLQILAGLIDTDGYLGGTYEITTKYQGLRDDILYLARSLGLAAYTRTKIGTIKSIGFSGTYHRITISGHIDEIPCKVPRKISKPRQQIKNVQHTGFRVEDIGEGEFFGFTLDGDGRFLLGDFTITHNTTSVELAQLVLTGEHKSMVLDKDKAGDFGVVLLRSPIALFDNTDSYIDWVPDAIAGYTTGAGWTKRKLFTDDESLEIKPQSFIAVATRNPASFRRDDVADRCVILRLERWKSFTTQESLKRTVRAEREILFGEYLYWLGQIIEALRARGDADAHEQFRMADFAAFGRVVGSVLGWDDQDITDMLVSLQSERDAFVNEGDPLLTLLRSWITYRTKHAGGNIGRMVTEFQLHAELETFAQANGIEWRDSPRTLAQKLRSTNIEREFRVEMHSINGQRHYQIWRHSDGRLGLVGDDEIGTGLT